MHNFLDIHISFYGDPEAGIRPVLFSIEEIVDKDDLEPEDREIFRTKIKEAFEILYDEKAEVFYSDEA